MVIMSVQLCAGLKVLKGLGLRNELASLGQKITCASALETMTLISMA